MTGIAVGLIIFCLIVIAVHDRERAAWRRERQDLLRRIQAPESARSERWPEFVQPEPVIPIALDDDQAYEKLRLEREGLNGGS